MTPHTHTFWVWTPSLPPAWPGSGCCLPSCPGPPPGGALSRPWSHHGSTPDRGRPHTHTVSDTRPGTCAARRGTPMTQSGACTCTHAMGFREKPMPPTVQWARQCIGATSCVEGHAAWGVRGPQGTHVSQGSYECSRPEGEVQVHVRGPKHECVRECACAHVCMHACMCECACVHACVHVSE